MNKSARRSWIIVPAGKPEGIAETLEARADVVVLDLVELIAERDRKSARKGIKTVLEQHADHGELFVQIDAQQIDEDLRACVWPGLAGVVMSRTETAQSVQDASALLERLEEQRGIGSGSVSVVPALETAQGNHAAYEIVTASPRVWGVTLGRADLVMDLRPEPSREIHLMPYPMQRLIIIAGAAGVTPIGAWWRAPDRGLLATPENTFEAGRRGRAIGYKGAMCLRANQVEPLNRAYA
jgi:citrate lyase subunit beta / citryl-CoA lyase